MTPNCPHIPASWCHGATLSFLLHASTGITGEQLPPSPQDLFRTAEQSLRQGAPVDITTLQSYPLYPALRYQQLIRRVAQSTPDELHAFLSQYPDSPWAEKLRMAWLRQRFTAQQWADVVQNAIPSDDPDKDCLRRRAWLALEQPALALENFSMLWMRPAALPDTCDPLLGAWRSQGMPTPAQLWQRLVLMMERYPATATVVKALRDQLPAADQRWADQWIAIAKDPTLLLQPERLDLTDSRAAILIADGLKRWGRRNVLAACAVLDGFKARAPALIPALGAAERVLGLWLASDFHPNALARLAAVPDPVADQDTREWRVRLCLRNSDWPGALQWLDRLTPEEQASPRWQYWRARALAATGKTTEADTLYRTLATQRDYHGFLAADQVKQPYNMAHTPLAITDAALHTFLEDTPGLQRAREWYRMGRLVEAETEWKYTLARLDRPAQQRAAILAHRWDWYPQAIATAAQAAYWNDIEVRFPLPYRDEILNRSAADGIDPAWAYAIMRQESTFRPDAKSSVGALGLMQLMPQTARHVAQTMGETVTNDSVLIKPAVNIRYGVHYLRELLQDMQQHPFLVTASYNAGPHKVRKWLPEKAQCPADQWAETIPYRETRAYVQRVMEYATVYRQRLHLPAVDRTLDARALPIQPLQPLQPANPAAVQIDTHSQAM